jgi:hypothetical protein
MTDAYSECWNFKSRGTCPRGYKCKWTHLQISDLGASDSDTLATVYHEVPDESQLCWNYMRTGSCPRADRCRWVHDLYFVQEPFIASPQFPAFPHTPTGASHVPAISTTLYDFDQSHSPQIPTTPESYWDQFSENQRLFGTTSSYDPSMSAYTTPLCVDSLTPEQIAKAEELAKVSLPSEKLSQSETFPLTCPFCSKTLSDIDGLIDHAECAIHDDHKPVTCTEEGTKALKGALKRKSWIVVQETLPAGLVSQIQGIYKRQITSSTNMQSILDSIDKSDQLSEDVRSHLHKEIVCVVTNIALKATAHCPSK